MAATWLPEEGNRCLSFKIVCQVLAMASIGGKYGTNTENIRPSGSYSLQRREVISKFRASTFCRTIVGQGSDTSFREGKRLLNSKKVNLRTPRVSELAKWQLVPPEEGITD